MRFLYEHPELGPTEQDVGFRCSCGFEHPPGGIAITLRELREVRFYCQVCGKHCGSWTPPIAGAAIIAAKPDGVMRITCASCNAVAMLPLPLPDGAVVHCVHCGASNPLPAPTSPVDPDSPAGDDERERST